MKIIVISLVTGFMNIVAYESFGQLAINLENKKPDTAQIVPAKAKLNSLPTPIYNDLPKMPKKKERANKLLREDQKEIKKGAVKRKYKHERRVETRLAKRRDNKHGIMAERKKKDRMFK